ncbi:MAG: DUF1018 domain-containing protein [Methylococcaceae bacterium]|nr:MAG: DUF1018 domain-containing protein [Methylococcaceae bacterium]
MARSSPWRTMTDKQRQSAIAKIHIAKTQVGMADTDYRALLRRVAQVDSSKKLNDAGIDKVLAEMARLGFQATRPARAGRKASGSEDKQPLLDKIDAMLAEAGLSSRYADGIATQMFSPRGIDGKKPPVIHRTCDARQLRAIVTALDKQAKKKEAA